MLLVLFDSLDFVGFVSFSMSVLPLLGLQQDGHHQGNESDVADVRCAHGCGKAWFASEGHKIALGSVKYVTNTNTQSYNQRAMRRYPKDDDPRTYHQHLQQLRCAKKLNGR
jgi:hypothetical protein